MSGVSVIISAYKASAFIEECLDSILEQQTNFDYEVLVGVDGCPDTLNKIKDILYKYKDFNFRFYYSEINVGKYLMVNSMAKESIYDNLAFFDVDDIMMNNFIEDNFKHLSDNSPYVLSKGLNFDSNNTSYSPVNYHGVLFITKSLFFDINGYDSYRCGMDDDLRVRLSKLKIEPYNTNEVSYKRRIHPDSLTRTPEFNPTSIYRNNIFKLLEDRRRGDISVAKLKEYSSVNLLKV